MDPGARTLKRIGRLFGGLLVSLVVASAAQAQSVRTTDSLWVSTSLATGEPKLTSIDIPEGSTITLYLWLKVEAEPDYDLGGLYLPLSLDDPGDVHFTVGPAGGTAWSGNTAAVPGAVDDPALSALPPFSTWSVRALYEKTYAALGGASHALAGFVQYGAPGTGWSGRAPVAALAVDGVALGSGVVDLESHPLDGGGTGSPALSNSEGSKSWLPVVVPLTINVISPTGTPDPTPVTAFRLHGVVPSPQRDDGTVTFELPREALVSIAVFDGRGRQVRVIVPETLVPAGRHTEDVPLAGLGSGSYFLRLRARAPESGAVLFHDSQKIARLR